MLRRLKNAIDADIGVHIAQQRAGKYVVCMELGSVGDGIVGNIEWIFNWTFPFYVDRPGSPAFWAPEFGLACTAIPGSESSKGAF